MTFQEDLRQGQVVAVWAGDFDTEGDIHEYFGPPFESDFGFLLDHYELPEVSRLFVEARRKPHYSLKLQKTDIRELLSGFSSPADWTPEAERLCRQKGIHSAKAVAIFPHLRYREELCRNPAAPVRFIGNVPWAGGAESWAVVQSIRIIVPPFPKLIRRDFGTGLFCWEGIVQLDSWKGFATHGEISGMPSKERVPDGVFSMSVDPGTEDKSSRPTPEQGRAFEHLIKRQAALRDAFLEQLLKVYPAWRENYYGEKWSSDGGKTFQSGWESPEMCPPDNMPEVKQPRDLMRLIAPGGVSIRDKAGNGIAEIRVSFSCKWDEEHGFAVLIRRGEEVEVGDFDLGI